MKTLLNDGLLFKLLEKMDSDMADAAEAEGCDCGEEKLHHGDYPRKPRGGSRRWNKRHSFCCANKGCRKRKTPPSVRFLGRKVYVGVMVVLVSAMMHGLKPKRVKELRKVLHSIDRRTLERWRTWWLENFAGSRFWKSARARFMPCLDETVLPLSLVNAFKATVRDGMARLLEFISPITIPVRKGAAVM